MVIYTKLKFLAISHSLLAFLRSLLFDLFQQSLAMSFEDRISVIQERQQHRKPAPA